MVKWSKYFGAFAKSGRGKYKGRWARIVSGREIMPKGFDPEKYYRDQAKKKGGK